MLVKSYRYRTKKENLGKLREIEKEADKIYKQSGLKQSTFLKSVKDEYTTRWLLEYYPSKREYEGVMKKVNMHPRIKKLWSQFIVLVNEEEIKEEEFETES